MSDTRVIVIGKREEIERRMHEMVVRMFATGDEIV